MNLIITNSYAYYMELNQSQLFLGSVFIFSAFDSLHHLFLHFKILFSLLLAFAFLKLDTSCHLLLIRQWLLFVSKCSQGWQCSVVCNLGSTLTIFTSFCLFKHLCVTDSMVSSTNANLISSSVFLSTFSCRTMGLFEL